MRGGLKAITLVVWITIWIQCEAWLKMGSGRLLLSPRAIGVGRGEAAPTEVSYYLDEVDICLKSSDSFLSGKSKSKDLNTLSNLAIKAILLSEATGSMTTLLDVEKKYKKVNPSNTDRKNHNRSGVEGRRGF